MNEIIHKFKTQMDRGELDVNDKELELFKDFINYQPNIEAPAADDPSAMFGK